MLKGKTVVLAVTGGIAAYKTATLASMLRKQKANVEVLMTKNATNFITPITFESLTGNKCMVDTFDRNFEFHVEHVALAKKADIVLVAPATANVIGKLAGGIADDMLTTTVLACQCPKLIAPAMNTQMWENPIVQDNLKKLERFGHVILPPLSGYLACGDTGAGKMQEPEMLFEQLMLYLAEPKDMEGCRVLVTAGPTQEPLDPVRFLSNHSTGKMGYALARHCARRGAKVTLISGPTSLAAPLGVTMVPVQTAQQMFDAVREHFDETDIVIKAAAVADYRPAEVAAEKMKKQPGDQTLRLERTQDILSWLGEHKKEGQFLCGFAMETQDLLEQARAKLQRKKADLIVANSIRQEGAGFGTDTNVVTLVSEKEERALGCMSKDDTAREIVNEVLKLWK